MTRFTDQLFDDLMRDHGEALARTTVAAPKRHLTARPVLLTAGAGGVAVATAVGALVAGGASPAYALTNHPDGTVTLAVYQASGIAAANSKLHQLGDRVVVVPVKPGCPSINSLPAPGVPAASISVQVSTSGDGSVTVDAHGVPVGDLLVLGLSTTGGGFQFSVKQTSQGATSTGQGRVTASGSGSGQAPETKQGFGAGSRLTSGPAPSCVSLPAMPSPGVPGGPGGTHVSGSAGSAVSSS